MTIPTAAGLARLTEKEKQTLRLIVRGHDAKSTARSLGLSVHTINERLREARRKLSVASSREAARLLLEAEGHAVDAAGPQSHGDKQLGADSAASLPDREAAPESGAARRRWPPLMLMGGSIMALAALLLAVAGVPPASPVIVPASETAPATDPAVVDAARQFLALIDQDRWAESYRATGGAFRRLNPVAAWEAASRRMRAEHGAMLSRTLVSQENLPAPPAGYEVVKFRTRFSRSGETTETVSLEREHGAWRVVGVIVG